jgi:hypothetical protein
LKDKGHGIPPLRGIAKASDLGVELCDQRFEVIKDFKRVAKKDLFGWGEGNGIPPGKILVGERTAWWKLEHVTVK